MSRALFSLALVGGALATVNQTTLEDTPSYTSTLGRLAVLTVPSSNSDAYPYGAFSAYDVAFNGDDDTDLLVEGKDGAVSQYKGAVPDVFAHGDATVLFPMARQVSKPLPIDLDYSAFLTELWFGKDDDCDDGKACMWLHGEAVDITSSRCDGGAATAKMFPCWTYPDSTDCAPYDTSTGNPDCGNDVTVQYFSQGIFTLSNGTLLDSVHCAQDVFVADPALGKLSFNKTLAVVEIATDTVENATTVSFLVVHVVVTTTSIEFPDNSYVSVNSLMIAVDPLTGALAFDQFYFLPAPSTHGAAMATEWDDDTLRVNVNTTTILARAALPWESIISTFSSSFGNDFRESVALVPFCKDNVADEPAFPTSPSCDTLFAAASESSSFSNFAGTLTLEFLKDDVDIFFYDSGAVEGLSCGFDFAITPQSDDFPSAFVFRRVVQIDPPVVPVCADPVAFISYYDYDLASLVLDQTYDFFSTNNRYTAITPNSNSSTGLLLTLVTEWKGLGVLQNMTSEITLNDDKRCMVGLLNGTMLSDSVSDVGGKPFNDASLDMCVNQTVWNVEASNTTLPNITVTCNMCGLTTFVVDPLSFEYHLPSCNYKPCQHSVLYYLDVININAESACAVWNETDFADPLLLTIDMVGSDSDGNTDTKSFDIPVFADCVTDLGCDLLGYAGCTGMRRRGLWSDIVDEVKEVIHDVVDDVLDTKKGAKTSAVGRRTTLPPPLADRFYDVLYTWLYVDGGVASAGITPAQITAMRALPLAGWLTYLQTQFPDIDNAVLQNIIDNLRPRGSTGVDVPIVASVPSAQATFGVAASVGAVSMFAVVLSNFFMSFGSGVSSVVSVPTLVQGYTRL